MQISILTLNTFGVNIFSRTLKIRTEQVAKTIIAQSIDIILLQEVVLYNHIHYLQSLLPEYKYTVFRRSIVGPKGGLVILSRVPISIVDYRKFKKNGSLRDLSIIHVLAQRGLLISRLDNTDTYILNTHFSANISNMWNNDNKYVQVLESQIEDLHQFILENKSEALIIGGDFNIPKTSRIYTKLVNPGLIDVFKDENRPTHLGDIFFERSSLLRVDYLFVYKGNYRTMRVLDKQHVFDKPVLLRGRMRYVSDHVGLQAHIDLK